MDSVPGSATDAATTAGTASSLPRLVPVDMTPAIRAAASVQEDDPETHCQTDPAVLEALARVKRVEIHAAADAGRKAGYEIHVFFQPTASRIPVPVTSVASPKWQKTDDLRVIPTPPPDIVVPRNFADFRRLRDDVYYAAYKGHKGDVSLRSCAFCASVVDMVLADEQQPHRFHEWLYSSMEVCTLLEGFLKLLFDRALGSAAASAHRSRRHEALSRPVCPVHAAGRRLVAEFLGAAVDNQ